MNSYIVKWFLILISILGFYGCAQVPEANSNKTYASDFTLSPDGKRILFSLSKGNKYYDLATYEISTGTIKAFKLTGNDYYLEPVFSPNGKEICFVAGKRLKGGNVYILNCETGNVRQMTHTESMYPERKGPFNSNKLPNFSPDGKKIIFWRSGAVFERHNGNLMTTDWDLFEVDVVTGAESKLTNQKFFTIRRPYHLPDGKTNELKPAFVHGDISSRSSVSGSGDVVFVSKTNHLDDGGGRYTFDLFIRSQKSIKRLTKERFSNELNNPFISFDGSRVVFQADKKERSEIGWTVWIINKDGTGLRDINFMDLLNN